MPGFIFKDYQGFVYRGKPHVWYLVFKDKLNCYSVNIIENVFVLPVSFKINHNYVLPLYPTLLTEVMCNTREESESRRKVDSLYDNELRLWWLCCKERNVALQPGSKLCKFIKKGTEICGMRKTSWREYLSLITIEKLVWTEKNNQMCFRVAGWKPRERILNCIKWNMVQSLI